MRIPDSPRTRLRAPRAAGPGVSPYDRAPVRTTGAGWRTPAPSRTPPRPPATLPRRLPPPTGTQAALSFPSRPRRAPPARGSHPGAQPTRAHRALRTRCDAPARSPGPTLGRRTPNHKLNCDDRPAQASQHPATRLEPTGPVRGREARATPDELRCAYRYPTPSRRW